MQEKQDVVSDFLAPEDISGDHSSISFLVSRQLDRINFLLSIGASSNDKEASVARGLVFGLGGLEGLLAPYLPQSYFEKAEKLKTPLFERAGVRLSPQEKQLKGDAYTAISEDLSRHYFLSEHAPSYCIFQCLKWYNLLCLEGSKTSLYPVREKPMRI